MTKKKVKIEVQEAEETVESMPEPAVEVPAKPTVKELAGKFQDYPCLADRHPQKIEDWVANYTAAKKALQEAVA